MSFLKHLTSSSHTFTFTIQLHALLYSANTLLQTGDRIYVELARDSKKTFKSPVTVVNYNARTEGCTFGADDVIRFTSTIYSQSQQSSKQRAFQSKKFQLSVKLLQARNNVSTIATATCNMSVYCDLSSDQLIERHIKLEAQSKSGGGKAQSQQQQETPILHCTITTRLVAPSSSNGVERRTSVSTYSTGSNELSTNSMNEVSQVDSLISIDESIEDSTVDDTDAEHYNRTAISRRAAPAVKVPSRLAKTEERDSDSEDMETDAEGSTSPRQALAQAAALRSTNGKAVPSRSIPAVVPTARLLPPHPPRRESSTGSNGSSTSSQIDDFLQQQKAKRQLSNQAAQPRAAAPPAVSVSASTAQTPLYSADMSLTEMLDAEHQFTIEARPLLQKLVQSTLVKHTTALSKRPNQLQRTAQPPMLAATHQHEQPAAAPRHRIAVQDMPTRELEMLVKRYKLQQQEHNKQREAEARQRGMTVEQLAVEEKRQKQQAAEEMERRQYAERLQRVQQDALAALQQKQQSAVADQDVSERYWNNLPASACVWVRAFCHWKAIDPSSCYRLSQFDRVTRKDKQRLGVGEETADISAFAYCPRNWMVEEFVNSLWKTANDVALNESALCFVVNNGAMLLHLLQSCEQQSTEATNGTASTGSQQHTTSMLSVATQPLTSSALSTSLNTLTGNQRAITHIQHWLSNTFSHLLRHAINLLSQQVRVSHLLPQSANGDEQQMERMAELLMMQSAAVGTLIETLDVIYDTMTAHQLLEPVVINYILLLIQHLNSFLCNYIFSDPSTCVLDTAMHLQIVSSALDGWSRSKAKVALINGVQSCTQHMKQIALLLLADKAALNERYRKYRLKAKQSSSKSDRTMKLDLLSQYAPLNPVHVHYLLMHYSISQERARAGHEDGKATVNGHSDVVPSELLRYVQKQARVYQRQHPTDNTTDGQPNGSAEQAMPPTKSEASLLLEEDVNVMHHLLLPSTLTIDVSLRQMIGRFDISAVQPPTELSSASGFEFLTRAKQRMVL